LRSVSGALRTSLPSSDSRSKATNSICPFLPCSSEATSAAKSDTPCGPNTIASPSIDALAHGNARAASTTAGNLSVQSSPERVKMLTSPPPIAICRR